MDKPSQDTLRKSRGTLNELLPEELEEVLAHRVLKRSIGYLVGIFTFLGLVLGTFGYRQVLDAKQEIEATKSALIEEVEATREVGQALRERLTEQEASIRVNERLLTTYTGAMWETARRAGEEMGSARRQIEDEVEHSRQMAALMAASIDSMRDARYFVRDSVARRLGSIDSQIAAVDGEMTRLDERLERTDQKVIGGGVYTVRKRSGVIFGTPFDVRYSRIADSKIHEFAIYDRETERRLYGPMDLGERDPDMVTASDGRTYRFNVRVIDDRKLPFLTGGDQAQIHFQPIPVAVQRLSESAPSGAGRHP